MEDADFVVVWAEGHASELGDRDAVLDGQSPLVQHEQRVRTHHQQLRHHLWMEKRHDDMAFSV